MNTLLLTPVDVRTGGWDITTDDNNNIALATGGYALAQDVASACRTFLGEVWYNTTFGVPYFQNILGQLPALSFIKLKLTTVALSVPGIARIVVFLTGPGVDNRSVGGQIQITAVDGTLSLLNTQKLGDLWYISAVND